MRLSSLVTAAVLLCSVCLFAQRSGGGGGSFGGGHSSGGGSSSGSSHSGAAGAPRGSGISSSSGHSGSSSSGAAHSSSSRTSSERSGVERSVRDPERTGLNIRPGLLNSPVTGKIEEKPEKKGVFSFLHHRKPEPQPATFIKPRAHCLPGQPCVARRTCQTALAWYGSYCGGLYDQSYWFNACQSLADQLAAQQERMRATGATIENIRYQTLRNQYEQCARRNGRAPFSSYLFMSELEYP